MINGLQITKGLIIDKPWIGYILDGLKLWEMRSSNTKLRGHIALIEKGSGMIVGVATLIDSIPQMDINVLMDNFDKHRVDYNAHPELLRWNRGWVLENAQKVDPVRYVHPRGAVIWVNL